LIEAPRTGARLTPPSSLSRSLGVVPGTFERTHRQVAPVLSAHGQLRSLRQSDPDALIQERTAPDNRTRPGELNRAVRTWARQQGTRVNTTGKLPQSRVDAYLASVERS
jgi:hypothetical protein